MQYLNTAPSPFLAETYVLQSYHVDHRAKHVAGFVQYVRVSDTTETESISFSLDDTMGFMIDPSFEFTKESIEALPIGANPHDPLTWGKFMPPRVDVPERKFYSRVTAAAVSGNMEREIIECLIIAGVLPCGDKWSIR